MPTQKMQQRRDTTANWTSANPVLAAGEIGFESGVNKFKIGDGTAAWNSLAYAGGTTNASDLTSGTLNDARLSSNVLKATAQTLTNQEKAQARSNIAAQLASANLDRLDGTAAQQRDAIESASSRFASGLPSTLHNVVLSNLSGPVPTDYFGGFLWGVNYSTGEISRSSNFGQTWTQVRATSYALLQKIIPTPDGEVVLVTSSSGYKSSGWSTNPATATFTEKFTVTGTGAEILAWGVDASEDGQKIIVGEYAGGGFWANSQKIWISTNGGVTFTVKYNSLSRYGSLLNENTHIHACCYDKWEDRFWMTEGHSAPGGIGGVYYSDDNGDTWTHLDDPSIHENGAYTVMVPTKDGIVCGSDNVENGVFILPRTTTVAKTKAFKAATWINSNATPGSAGFAWFGWTDPTTGLVYIGYKNEYPVHMPIFVSDGKSAKLIHLINDDSLAGDRLDRQIVVDGKLIGYYTKTGATVNRLITAEVSSAMESSDVDTGNVLGGVCRNPNTLVVGKTNSALNATNTTVVGVTNTVTGAVGENTIIGRGNSSSGFRNLLIGELLTATGNGQFLIGGPIDPPGNPIVATGSFQIGIGKNINLGSVGLLGIGLDVTVLGTGALGIGVEVRANGANCFCIGNNVKALDGSDAAVANAFVVGVNARAFAGEAHVEGIGALGLLWSTAVGFNAKGAAYSTAIGHAANAGYDTVGAYYCTAIGDRAIVTAALAMAVGEDTQASHSGAIVVGPGLRSTATNQVRFGDRHIELDEITDPAAPASNRSRLFTRDNGSGKTQLCVRFATGAIQVIATEP